MIKNVITYKYYCNYCKKELFLTENMYRKKEKSVYGILKIYRKKYEIVICSNDHEKFENCKRHICWDCFYKEAVRLEKLEKERKKKLIGNLSIIDKNIEMLSINNNRGNFMSENKYLSNDMKKKI